MNKVAQRLLTFFLGVPAVICIVWVDFARHLPLQIVTLLISVFAANEFYKMLKPKSELFPRWIILLFDGIVFVSQYIFLLLGYNPELNIWIMAICSIILMGISVFNKNFENITRKIALSTFIIFYCGFLFSFVPSLAFYNNSRFFIILFLIIVFMCDSCAWFFGILFGKNNRGIFPASPNKSVAGFVGGLAGAVLFACLINFLFTNVIPEPYGIEGYSYIKISIIAFVTALFGIIGDLIESIFKRDCGVKDSGRIVPGRGGLLDCIDSLTGAASIYFILIYFILNAQKVI